MKYVSPLVVKIILNNIEKYLSRKHTRSEAIILTAKKNKMPVEVIQKWISY